MNEIILDNMGLAKIQTEPVEIVVPARDHRAMSNDEMDFETARLNIAEIIEVSKDAIDDLLNVAKQSSSARDYEVLGQLMRTAADLNNTLISLPEKRKKALNEKPEAPTTQNNTLIVGTTADISKMIEDKIKSS